jgi:flavin reductase (DIM6/NTAB) family NADH-FMN oxidoreductase RutF
MHKPWNITNSAVYSLATADDMNICTYVTAISMQPKLFAIAVYHNTKTLYNVTNSTHCVLQILHTHQAKLVNVLGKKSGWHYNKLAYLSKRNLLDTWQHIPILHNACAYMHLQKQQVIVTGGDHDLYIFKVLKYKTNYDDDILTHNYLREQKIIRA